MGIIVDYGSARNKRLSISLTKATQFANAHNVIMYVIKQGRILNIVNYLIDS